MAAATRWIGRPLRRREDERFLRGRGRYVGDITLPGMLHLVIVRSPFAHARVRAIRTAPVLRAPGVVAVVTGADLAGRVQPMPMGAREGATVASAPHPILASETVRYVGEPVAAVLAQTPAAAADAAALLEVDYDPLPAVVDPHEALGGAVRVHEALPDNVLLRWHRSGGDVEGAFRSAARVVRGSFTIPRLIAAPVEPRGAVAAYDPGADLLTLWCSAHDPHRPRAQLSRVLGRPEDRIRLIVPDVGGAFGSKGALAPEAAVAAFLAIVHGRPVRWIEDRRENFAAAHQGRGVSAEVEMAVDGSGALLGIRARLLADLGAYLLPSTANPPVTTAMLMTGAYAISAAEVELVGVATNKVPTGPYRGAGRPEAAFIVERMVDLVARDLGLDPVQVRRRNFIPPERFPYRTPLGFTYDSGNYARALDRAWELLEGDRWRREQQPARAEGRLLGIGVSGHIERIGSGLWEGAAVSVEPDGRVVVRMGPAPQGQGHETTFAQIAAEALGLDPGAIVVQWGDSAVVPRGVGTFASRSVTIGGSALLVALDRIREKATGIAARLLEAAPSDIVWDSDRLHVRGMPARAVAWTEIAAVAYDPVRLPADLEMGLAASATFRLPGPVFAFGAYGAVVEIERETGAVRLLRLVAVDDAGRIVNPLLAEGQVIGSTAQGLGAALVEAAVYDADGQLQTASFLDYSLLRAADLPTIASEFLETPSPFNPLGAKGIGETGCMGAPAAVANAVADALAPLGIRHVDIPYTPQKLWRILAAGAAQAAPR
ncbi:MAG: xanthine dehydrogenase family protein molybdopterin-binding subunit [Armatimonadota bacterium]|nr:xanthine dehydrogenase family protein molybdopterin-binding subunit [Armatimonadota bacterium]MDR7520582.1 xanthine dehydrogenase family protein molybdopterin-binding subunit [Armatimonadota bacterium]